MGPFRISERDMVTQNIENAKALSTFLTTVFTSKCSSHTTHTQKVKGRKWGNKEPSTVGEDWVGDCLRNLKLLSSWDLRRYIYRS